MAKHGLKQTNHADRVADLAAALETIEHYSWPVRVRKAVRTAAHRAVARDGEESGTARGEDGVLYRYDVRAERNSDGSHSLSITVEPVLEMPVADISPERQELEWYCRLVRDLDAVAYVADADGNLLATSVLCDAYLQDAPEAEHVFRLGVLAHGDADVLSSGELSCYPQTLELEKTPLSVRTCKLPLRDSKGMARAVLSVSESVGPDGQPLGQEPMRSVLDGCWAHLTSDAQNNMQAILRELRSASGALCAVYERVGAAATCVSMEGWDEVVPGLSLLADEAGRLSCALGATRGLVVIRDVALPQILAERLHGDTSELIFCARLVRGEHAQGASASGDVVHSGVVGLVFRGKRAADIKRTELLSEAGAALALEELRYARAQREQVLYAICEAGTSATTVAGLMAHVHEELEQVMHVPDIYLALYDPAQKVINFPYYVESNLPDPASNLTRSRAADQGLTEYVLQHGEQVFLHQHDIRQLARNGEIKANGRVPCIYVGTPLVNEGTTFGVMAVQSYAFESDFSVQDAAFLQAVAGQLGSAVTHRLRVRALEESEARYRLYDEATSDVVWSCSDRGIITFVSPSVERLLGYKPDDLIGTSVFDIVSSASHESVSAAVSSVFRDDSSRELTLELGVLSGDGSELLMEAKVSVFRASDSDAVTVMGIARDITPRREYERQFRISSKMESLGQLSGGIAHHYNNLLTVINGYSQFLLSTMEQDDPQREDVQAILNAGKRAAELTSQLLDFGRQRMLSVKQIDLNHEMERARQFVSSILDERIELALELGDEALPVLMDVSQLQQAIMILALNSRDAMPAGGSLSLSLRRVEKQDLPSALGEADANEAYAQLTVADTGVGMTPDVMEHLFEPFFTTKDVGEGTGLGLATVYAIVTQSGGYIDVMSKPGEGTTFDLYVPLVPGDNAPSQRTKAAAAPDSSFDTGDHQTVLLVEDEADVRILATRMLERLGYRVIAAEDAETALELAPGSGVDVLLTDVVLPGLTSTDLHERLLAQIPDLPVIYMSGYGDGSVVAQEAVARGAYFVSKPFTPSALATALRSVLS